MSIKLCGDFNGLFGSEEGDLLCLSHGETARNENGEDVVLQEGMVAIAFDKDEDEHGNHDDLIANGIVMRSPEWLQCYGSRWVLKIDERGVYHESEMTNAEDGE